MPVITGFYPEQYNNWNKITEIPLALRQIGEEFNTFAEFQAWLLEQAKNTAKEEIVWENLPTRCNKSFDFASQAISGIQPTLNLKTSDPTHKHFAVAANGHTFYVYVDSNRDGILETVNPPLDINDSAQRLRTFGKTVWHSGNFTPPTQEQAGWNGELLVNGVKGNYTEVSKICWYKRDGSVVNIWFSLSVNGLSNNSGTVTIRGIPFSPIITIKQSAFINLASSDPWTVSIAAYSNIISIQRVSGPLLAQNSETGTLEVNFNLPLLLSSN